MVSSKKVRRGRQGSTEKHERDIWDRLKQVDSDILTVIVTLISGVFLYMIYAYTLDVAVALPWLIGIIVRFNTRARKVFGNLLKRYFCHIGYGQLQPTRTEALPKGVKGPRYDINISLEYITPLLVALWYSILGILFKEVVGALILFSLPLSAEPKYWMPASDLKTPIPAHITLRIFYTVLILMICSILRITDVAIAWTLVLSIGFKMAHIAATGLNHWTSMYCETGEWYWPDDTPDDNIEAWERLYEKDLQGGYTIGHKNRGSRKSTDSQPGGYRSRYDYVLENPNGVPYQKVEKYVYEEDEFSEPEIHYRGDESEEEVRYNSGRRQGLKAKPAVYPRTRRTEAAEEIESDASSYSTHSPTPPPTSQPRKTHPPKSPPAPPRIPRSSHSAAINTLLRRLSSSTPPSISGIRLTLPRHIHLAAPHSPSTRAAWLKQLVGISGPTAIDLFRMVLKEELATHKRQLEELRSGMYKPRRRMERWADDEVYGEMLGMRRVRGEGEGYYLSVLEDEAARWPDDRSDGSHETDVFVLEKGYPGNVVPRRGWLESVGEVYREERNAFAWFLKGPVLAVVMLVAAVMGVVVLFSMLNGWPVDLYNREERVWEVIFRVWDAVKMGAGLVVVGSKTVFRWVGGDYLVEAWTSRVSREWIPQNVWGYLTDNPEALRKWIEETLISAPWTFLKKLWSSNDAVVGNEILYAYREKEAQDPKWKYAGLGAIVVSSYLLSYNFGVAV